MLQRQNLNILIVEDEDMIREIFNESVQRWGFKSNTAMHGREALEKCKKDIYHIVITDLNMPFMDGMSLLKRIKDRWPYIEVIVVTGYATIELAIEAMKIGAYDFILKPVNFEQVKFTLDKCFQKINAQHENAQLREVNNQLTELNELKDKFLSITNHEIRTPLTVIKGYLEILNITLEEQNPEVQEILSTLNDTTQELGEAVERMHLLSRLNRGRKHDLKIPFNITETAERVCQEMHMLFSYRKIEFSKSLPKKAIFIEAPPKSIQLVLRELLQNALKFTPDNGRVEFVMEQENEWIKFEVTDSGVGIPYDKQNLIFNEFYEVQDVKNHSTSAIEFMGGGMGIGLSLVKEIITELGGKIHVNSEQGKGASFYVFLPESSLLQGENNVATQRIYQE